MVTTPLLLCERGNRKNVILAPLLSPLLRKEGMREVFPVTIYHIGLHEHEKPLSHYEHCMYRCKQEPLRVPVTLSRQRCKYPSRLWRFSGYEDNEERNFKPFPFHSPKIQYLVLTHAHIDHSGLIPKLVKDGFQGKILTTTATVDLCGVMLRWILHTYTNGMPNGRIKGD